MMRSTMGRLGRLVLSLAGLAGLAAGHGLVPAGAQTPSPACKGRDMLAELATTDPALHARVLAEAKAIENANAILWKVTSKAGKASYLFGTVHVTDERATNLSPKIRAAIATSSKLALELDDFSPEAMGKAMARVGGIIAYTDGGSLSKSLAPAEFEIAKKAVKRVGMPAEMAGVIRPWLITLLMALPDCELKRTAAGLQALDLKLHKEARQRGTPIVGLETIEDQLKAMAAVPDADQVSILRAGLKMYDRIEDLLETVLLRYLERNLGVIMPLQLALGDKLGQPRSAHVAFEKHVVEIRNRRMRDAALPLLEAGGAFIGVGALHLPGKTGLVALLREAGYTVTPEE